jgi:hypothetical protein
MMDVDTLSELIKAFFDIYQDHNVIGIVLPTGWFGKPYDNYYTLISIDVDPEEEVLSLDFGYGWHLSFKPLSAELSENRRKLTVRVRSGTMVTTTVRQQFGSGEVVFCVEDGESSRAALEAKGEMLQPFIR